MIEVGDSTEIEEVVVMSSSSFTKDNTTTTRNGIYAPYVKPTNRGESKSARVRWTGEAGIIARRILESNKGPSFNLIKVMNLIKDEWRAKGYENNAHNLTIRKLRAWWSSVCGKERRTNPNSTPQPNPSTSSRFPSNHNPLTRKRDDATQTTTQVSTNVKRVKLVVPSSSSSSSPGLPIVLDEPMQPSASVIQPFYVRRGAVAFSPNITKKEGVFWMNTPRMQSFSQFSSAKDGSSFIYCVVTPPPHVKSVTLSFDHKDECVFYLNYTCEAPIRFKECIPLQVRTRVARFGVSAMDEFENWCKEHSGPGSYGVVRERFFTTLPVDSAACCVFEVLKEDHPLTVEQNMYHILIVSKPTKKKPFCCEKGILGLIE